MAKIRILCSKTRTVRHNRWDYFRFVFFLVANPFKGFEEDFGQVLF
jgi:hypothetical protein